MNTEYFSAQNISFCHLPSNQRDSVKKKITYYTLCILHVCIQFYYQSVQALIDGIYSLFVKINVVRLLSTELIQLKDVADHYRTVFYIDLITLKVTVNL